MKALLIHLDATPPRTHDLVELARLIGPICTEWSFAVEDLRLLTRAAVDFRYPGESADKQEASEAFELAARARAKLQALFGR